MSKSFEPKALAIGSGGFRGFMFLGALHRLYSEHWLDQVEEYAGSSVGSILCFLLVLGYTPREIWDATSNLHIGNFIHLSDNIFSHMGISTMNRMVDFLEHLTQTKNYKNPTFQELYDATGKVLYIPAFNMTTKTEKVFSVHTTPQVHVIEAVAMSCSIPFCFVPYPFQGQEYIDAGVCNPYPIRYVDRGNEVLGMYLEDTKTDSPVNRWNLIMTSGLDGIRNRAIELASPRCHHLILYPTSLDLTGITMDHENRLAMVSAGDALANLWILSHRAELPMANHLKRSSLSSRFVEESDHSEEEKSSPSSESDRESDGRFLE